MFRLHVSLKLVNFVHLLQKENYGTSISDKSIVLHAMLIEIMLQTTSQIMYNYVNINYGVESFALKFP